MKDIYLERVILEQVEESPNTDINEWMSRTVFAVLLKTIFGLPFDQDLYCHFHGQSYGVQQQLNYGFTLSPSFYYHRYKWQKDIQHIVESDPIVPCLLSQLKARKIPYTLDELSGIFWGGVYSVTSTLVTLLVYVTSHPLKRDAYYKNSDPILQAMIREAMRIMPSAPVITREIDNHTVLVCPFGLHKQVESPHEFKYERFINNLSCFQHNYFPFGHKESRYCVGMNYSLDIMFSIAKCIATKVSVRVKNPEAYDTIVHAGSIIPKDPVYGEVMFMNRNAHWCYIDTFHTLLFRMTHGSIHHGVSKGVKDIPNVTLFPTMAYRNIAEEVLGDQNGQCYHCIPPRRFYNSTINCSLKLLKEIKIDDHGTPWFSIEEAHRAIEKVFHVCLNDDRIKNYKQMSLIFDTMNTLERLNYIATRGLGAHLIRRGTNGYCIDLMHMSKYAVRQGLCHYGAKLIMDHEFRILGIKLSYTPVFDTHGQLITQSNISHLYYPSDKLWIFAYHIFMSSLITHVTLIQHALFCHFKEAGQFLYLMNKHAQSLGPSLRSFMRLFLFDTMYVNENALKLLVSEGGIIYRLFAFTPSETKRYLRNHYSSEYLPTSTIDTPFWRDYRGYTSIIDTFVKEILSTIMGQSLGMDDYAASFVRDYRNLMDSPYSTLHSILVDHIVNVSFWHEHVGNMSWYLLNPSILKPKVFKEYALEVFDSRQNTLQAVHLALFTSINKMPRIMGPLESRMDNEFTDEFARFHTSLNAWMFECNHLDPNFFECSVSL
jgi:hypothetical protein